MRAALAARKLAWARLTGQQLTDVLAYLQDLPETRAVTRALPLPPAGAGEQLFQSKGCANCHSGVKAPENLMKNDSRAATSMWKRSRSSGLQDRLMNQTVTDIAADMWNHLPKMKQPPPAMAPEEMREIVAYIWTRQCFTGRGNAANGRKIFNEKHCAACHEDLSSGAPKLGKDKDGVLRRHHRSGHVETRTTPGGMDEPEEAAVAAVQGATVVGPDRVLEFAVTRLRTGPARGNQRSVRARIESAPPVTWPVMRISLRETTLLPILCQ